MNWDTAPGSSVKTERSSWHFIKRKIREAPRQHHEHVGKPKNTKSVRSQDLAVDSPYGGRCLMQRKNVQKRAGHSRRMPESRRALSPRPLTNSSQLWNVEAMIGALAHRGLGDAKSDEPLLVLTASEQKLTNTAISSTVRGPCNGPNLEALLLRKEMV